MSEKKTLNAKAVVLDIKVGMTDTQLMMKYALSEKGLESLKKKLIAAGLLPEAELNRPSSPRPIGSPSTATGDGRLEETVDLDPRSIQLDKAPTMETTIAGKRKLSAKEILADVNAGLSNTHLMSKHEISAESLEKVLTKLMGAGLIQQSEFDQRMSALKGGKETPLWKCPSCGMPQPQAHEECPQCGILVSKYLEKQAKARQQTEVVEEPAPIQPESLSRPSEPSPTVDKSGTVISVDVGAGVEKAKALFGSLKDKAKKKAEDLGIDSVGTGTDIASKAGKATGRIIDTVKTQVEHHAKGSGRGSNVLPIILAVLTLGLYPLWKTEKLKTKSKAIITCAVAGFLVIGAVASKKADTGPQRDVPQSLSQESPAGRQVSSSKNTSPPIPPILKSVKKADLKEGEKYSKKYLSEMIRISSTLGLLRIGREKDSIETELVKQTFGQRMPPLKDVIGEIMNQEVNCDPQAERFVATLTDYIDWEYQLRSFDHEDFPRMDIQTNLRIKEQELNSALINASDRCKQAVRDLIKLVNDTIPPAIKERERILAAIAEKDRKEREKQHPASQSLTYHQVATKFIEPLLEARAADRYKLYASLKREWEREYKGVLVTWKGRVTKAERSETPEDKILAARQKGIQLSKFISSINVIVKGGSSTKVVNLLGGDDLSQEQIKRWKKVRTGEDISFTGRLRDLSPLQGMQDGTYPVFLEHVSIHD